MSPSAVPASKSYSIASIPADGIGPEVIDAAHIVLKTLAETLGSFDIDFTHYDWSSDTYKKTGKYIPDGGLDELKKHDAILFGAVGAPGQYTMFSPISTRQLGLRHVYRRSRPHLVMGSSTGDLPTVPTICQCAAHESLQRNAIATAELQARRSGLGHHPGE